MNSTIIIVVCVVSTVFTVSVAAYSVYAVCVVVKSAVVSVVDSYMNRVSSNLDGIVTILYVFPNAYGQAYGQYDRYYQMASYYIRINNIIK